MAEARTGTGGRRGGANRRGAAGRTGSPPRGGGGGPSPGPAASPRGPAGAPGAHGCPVAFCPVGMMLTFAEAARPDVVQHLLSAGHELMLAVKAMVDARAEATGASSGLEHIRIT